MGMNFDPFSGMNIIPGVNLDPFQNFDATPGWNAFGTGPTDQQSGPVGAGAPGQLGAGPGPGKTGGFLGIGNSNVSPQLAASGYRMYTPTAAPDNMAPFAGAKPFTAGETSLMNQLQTTAGGGGPSAAQSELTSATDQNTANQMALAASGRGSPGTMAGVQTAGTMAGQTAADQAAALRAREIASAQGQLGGVTAAGANQGITQGGDVADLNNNQWDFGNNLAAAQQGNLNNVIANSVTGANTMQNSLIQPLISGAGGLVSGALTAAAAAAHGAVADHPQVRLIGEAGPEAVVPIDKQGKPDMARATDPKLKWILDHHGYDGKADTGGGGGGDNHALLAQIVGLRQDIARMSGRAHG